MTSRAIDRIRAVLPRLRARSAGAARATGTALVRAIVRREPVHAVCPECAVDFVPELTASRCPICGWVPTDAPAVRRVDRGAERRAVAGLGFAWFAGVVIFALVAHFLYA